MNAGGGPPGAASPGLISRPHGEPHDARRLTRLYILALGAVALLSIVGQVVAQITIARQTSDSRVVNLAGRQRMLSQRISKLALLIDREGDLSQRRIMAADLETALALWEQTHRGLRAGDVELGLPGVNSHEVQQMLDSIEPHFRSMAEGAETLVRCAGDPAAAAAQCAAARQAVLDHEGDFLKGMNQIVFQYDAEAQARVARIRGIEIGLLMVTLIVLALEGAFVFRPAVQKIRDTLARLRESGRQLAAAKEAAEAASQAKSRFLATMTHEIRTPLAGVIGLAELSLDGSITPNTRRQLAAARDSAQQLLRLLDEVLDYSKIEAGRLELELRPLSVRGWLEGWLVPWENQARKRGLALSWTVHDDVPEHLTADSLRLSQILANLLSNALKFTERGTIRLSVKLVEPRDRRVCLAIAVEDSGIGIPPEQHARIFERFTQADSSTTRKYGGAGLGLAIAARLAELMEGSIQLDSQVGRGSTFTFTGWFELAPPPSAAASASPAELAADATPTTRPLEILLAEDAPSIRLVVATLLEKHGHRVTCVERGDLALAACKARPFDVVLLDFEMPQMDGCTAADQIRQWEIAHGKPRVPIIALTAHAGAEDRARSLAAGMDEHLAKPIDRHELYQTIARVTDRRFLGEAAAEAPGTPPAATLAQDPDLDSAFARLEQKEELWRELARLFVEDSHRSLAELQQAVAAREERRARLLAHRLEGQLGNFEARRAVQRASELIAAVARSDWPDAEARLMELLSETARLERCLERWQPPCTSRG